MNPENAAHSLHPAENRPDPETKPRSEAAGAANVNAPDPQHPPRRSHGLNLIIVAALVLIGMLFMGIAQANWPVIDISAVTQLIETVRLATDSLDQVTSAKQALLGEIAVYTGIWDDLTGDAYQLGENASSLTTEFSLTQIEAGLTNRRTNEQNAWPTATDVQDAYAGEDSTGDPTGSRRTPNSHNETRSRTQRLVRLADRHCRGRRVSERHRSHRFHAEQRNHPGARRTA